MEVSSGGAGEYPGCRFTSESARRPLEASAACDITETPDFTHSNAHSTLPVRSSRTGFSLSIFSLKTLGLRN